MEACRKINEGVRELLKDGYNTEDLVLYLDLDVVEALSTMCQEYMEMVDDLYGDEEEEEEADTFEEED